MTFSEIMAAIIITVLFSIGFSQAALPAFRAWNRANNDYQCAESIRFVAESFKNECSKPNRNIETWKRDVAIVRELESYEIDEMWQGGILRALKLSCVLSGEALEIIGLCTP
ncbi:hypothetical protein FACS189483_01410 [Spirochaetia bacterium]|nr:hypothetical protein FACS189483_01410 [Spirochaetia bacterium]